MNALELAIAANVPVMLIDLPGSGKTSYITSLAAYLQAHLELITLSARLPEDACWEPDIAADGSYRVRRPGWAQRLCALEAGKIGILCVDEYTSASVSLQAPFLRVINELTVGDELHLPESTRRVAIMNPPSSSCGGHELAPPTANRFCHLNYDMVSWSQWQEGLATDFAGQHNLKPTDLTRTVNEAKSRALIAQFTRRNAMARLWPKNIDPDFPAFPTRRTWTMAARLDAWADALKVDESCRTQAIAGCVGPGAAHEFLAWRKTEEFGDPLDMLKRPDDFVVPETADRIHLVLSAVTGAALGELPKHWVAIWKIIARVADAGARDIAGLAARQVASGAEKHPPSACNIATVIKEVRTVSPILRAAGLLK